MTEESQNRLNRLAHIRNIQLEKAKSKSLLYAAALICAALHKCPVSNPTAHQIADQGTAHFDNLSAEDRI